jgi:integrase
MALVVAITVRISRSKARGRTPPRDRSAKLKGAWTDPALGRVLFHDWFTEWQRTTARLRPNTEACDERLFRLHVLPRFGPMPLAKVGQRDVRAWVAGLTGTRLAPSTVRRCYQLLSKVMAAAVDAGMLPQSPCRRVPLPKVERQEVRFLTPAEVARLADAVAPRYRPLILLGAYGGLRIGEMAGLRRARVDLAAGTVQVVEVITEPKGVLHVGPPKTRRPPHGRASPVRPRRARRAVADAGRARGPRVHRAAGWRAARVAVSQPLLAAGGQVGRPGRAAHPRPSPHGGGAVDRRRRLSTVTGLSPVAVSGSPHWRP